MHHVLQPPTSSSASLAHDGHGAVLDDRVVLVALDHADVEEAAIFLIRHRLEQALAARRDNPAAPAPARCRRREQRQARGAASTARPDSRCRSRRYRSAPRIGELQRLVQRAGLEALHVVHVEEAEARAQRGAMRLDRPPHRLVRRVVVEDDDFEIVVVEPRQRDRASRSPSAAARCSTAHGSRRAALLPGSRTRMCAALDAPQARGQLDAFGQDDGAGEQHQRHHRADHQRDRRGSIYSSVLASISASSPVETTAIKPAHDEIARLAHARHAAQDQEAQQQRDDRAPSSA